MSIGRSQLGSIAERKKATSIAILAWRGVTFLSALVVDLTTVAANELPIPAAADPAIAAVRDPATPASPDLPILASPDPAIATTRDPATSDVNGSRSRVALFAGVSASGGSGRFHDLWAPTLGPEARLQFSAEHAFFALATHSFTAKPESEDLPSLDMIDTRCGAGLRFRVPGGLALEPEVHLGVLWMFAEEGFDEFAEEENECHWGIGGAASLALNRRWSIRAESRWSRVLTHTSIDRVLTSASLGYTFETPPWLARWLGS